MTPLDADSLRAIFDAPAPLTVGIEEELMLLDPDTHDLTPRANDLLERTDGDSRFKLEMPAAQFEIASPALRNAADVSDFLLHARRDLAQHADGIARIACAGVHPFGDVEGELNAGARYKRVAAESPEALREPSAPPGARKPISLCVPSQNGVIVASSSTALPVGCTLDTGIPREVCMAEEKASVLVVANRTAGSDELLEALCKRAAEGVAQFHLVVPATARGVSWVADMDAGTDAAEHDLEGALERLRGAGLEVDGEIGDADPVAAVSDAANAASYDEVIVSTLHKHVSKWLKLDLPSKAAHATGLPVTHVEARAQSHA